MFLFGCGSAALGPLWYFSAAVFTTEHRGTEKRNNEKENDKTIIFKKI